MAGINQLTCVLSQRPGTKPRPEAAEGGHCGASLGTAGRESKERGRGAQRSGAEHDVFCRACVPGHGPAGQ